MTYLNLNYVSSPLCPCPACSARARSPPRVASRAGRSRSGRTRARGKGPGDSQIEITFLIKLFESYLPASVPPDLAVAAVVLQEVNVVAVLRKKNLLVFP